jgi:hypothetical protein
MQSGEQPGLQCCAGFNRGKRIEQVLKGVPRLLSQLRGVAIAQLNVRAHLGVRLGIIRIEEILDDPGIEL